MRIKFWIKTFSDNLLPVQPNWQIVEYEYVQNIIQGLLFTDHFKTKAYHNVQACKDTRLMHDSNKKNKNSWKKGLKVVVMLEHKMVVKYYKHWLDIKT